MSVQVQLTPRAQVIANGFWTSSIASIYGLNYDPGTLAPSLVGLDYGLMSQTMGSFSDLAIDQYVQSVGANYRISDRALLNATVEFNKYDDRQPYLFDATGRYVSFAAGVTWQF